MSEQFRDSSGWRGAMFRNEARKLGSPEAGLSIPSGSLESQIGRWIGRCGRWSLWL
jgi:hypothetical protein